MAPPTTNTEEQEILVRGSAEHKDYLRHQFGRIKEVVNSFETRIAVAGRAMLLIYVVYITVKAGIGGSLPANMPPWANTALQILDIVMLALQVLGLEGSVPGLRHLAEELEDKGKKKEAQTVRRASNIAQWLLVATAVDIVLQNTHHWGTWDITNFAIAYANCLFVLRVLVIGLYLVAMAKLEHKGPKIISAHEAAKRQKAKEQEQIRLDNAAIQQNINEALTTWMAAQDQHLADWSIGLLNRLQEQQRDVLASMSPSPNVDMQAVIQAVAEYLIPQFQAKFQALDQAISRQNVAISEAVNQAKRLPEHAASRQRTQATKASSSQAQQAEQNVIRLVPANASRDELIAESIRLHREEGLSSYKIAEKLGKSAKTVQSWLSSGKNQAESEAIEAAN